MSRCPMPRPAPIVTDSWIGVPLTQGQFAKVDLADWPIVSAYNWCAVRRPTGVIYAYRGRRRVDGPGSPLISMHTQLTGWAEVDHASRDGLDNRRANLRSASRSQNNGNHVIRSDSGNTYKGVTKRAGYTWSAKCAGTYLGGFKTEEAAARAYDAEARRVFGEFARLNFPEGS